MIFLHQAFLMDLASGPHRVCVHSAQGLDYVLIMPR